MAGIFLRKIYGYWINTDKQITVYILSTIIVVLRNARFIKINFFIIVDNVYLTGGSRLKRLNNKSKQIMWNKTKKLSIFQFNDKIRHIIKTLYFN